MAKMGVGRGDGVVYGGVDLVTGCDWRVNRMSVEDRTAGNVSETANANKQV